MFSLREKFADEAGKALLGFHVKAFGGIHEDCIGWNGIAKLFQDTPQGIGWNGQNDVTSVFYGLEKILGCSYFWREEKILSKILWILVFFID